MFPQTVGQRDYFFYCLGACGDGSIDVKERHIRPKKVQKIQAFRVSVVHCWSTIVTAKFPLWEHINKPVCRVELPD